MAGISKKRIKTKSGEKIKYTISYYDIFGKQHTKGLYDTIKEAKKHLSDFERPKKIKNITYGYIFDRFLEKVKAKNSSGTFENYVIIRNKYFLKFNSLVYDKVDSLYWQSFFDEIEKKVSPQQAQNCLKFARAAVNWQIKHDNLEINVFNKIEPIKKPPVNINHLTIEELNNVLEVCKKCFKEYYPLLFTFIGTGAREGEIFALEKSDFDADKNCISITKQFTRNRLKLSPKTASSYRKIYIFDDLKEVLIEHIKTLKPDNPLLFPNKAGGYMDDVNLRERFWKKLLLICGITKRVRLHDLRGSYTDLALSSGLSIKFAQNQLGHARAETTTNVYMRNNQDMIDFAMQRLNSVFGKCEQNMSKISKSSENKVIQFPKRRMDKGI